MRTHQQVANNLTAYFFRKSRLLDFEKTEFEVSRTLIGIPLGVFILQAKPIVNRFVGKIRWHQQFRVKTLCRKVKHEDLLSSDIKMSLQLPNNELMGAGGEVKSCY